MKVGDPFAMHNLGNYYRDGRYGYPQDYTKGLGLYHRAGKLGNAASYLHIGYAYDRGEGVEVDKKKANHYYELAAIGGSVVARHNLGVDEENASNFDRALKNYMIAVRSGYDESLNVIKGLYSEGYATKEDYTKALQSYQDYLGEIKSTQRDEAASADDQFRYY